MLIPKMTLVFHAELPFIFVHKFLIFENKDQFTILTDRTI